MQIEVLNSNMANQLSDLLKEGDWIVLYYAEWCGHCQSMKPEWNKFKTIAPKKLNIAQIESSQIPALKEDPQIRGYPTIKMYNNNHLVGEFNQERTHEKMLDFVKPFIKEEKPKSAKKTKPAKKPKSAAKPKPTAKPKSAKKTKSVRKPKSVKPVEEVVEETANNIFEKADNKELKNLQKSLKKVIKKTDSQADKIKPVVEVKKPKRKRKNKRKSMKRESIKPVKKTQKADILSNEVDKDKIIRQDLEKIIKSLSQKPQF